MNRGIGLNSEERFMLVLSRKVGETIVITGLPGQTRELKVSVVGLRDGRVKLGFEADTDVRIDRSEVWNRRSKPYRSIRTTRISSRPGNTT
jgi:carbon storage regulator CsrA